MNRKWIALVLLTLSANFACAASFDCGKAGSSVEKEICGDKTLSLLDDELNEAYRIAKESLGDDKQLKSEQLKWLKKRTECNNERCLIDMYQKRIDELHRNSLKPVSGEYFVLAKSKLLESGFGDESDDICEKLTESLNKVRNVTPMICEMTFPKEATDFEVPVWERVKVDDADALSEVKRIIKDESSVARIGWLDDFDSFARNGRIGVFSSKFDFDGNGVLDVVYQIREEWNSKFCNYSDEGVHYDDGSPNYRYVVKTDSVSDDKHRFDAVNGRVFGGVFMYKRLSYFHRWKYYSSGEELGMIAKKYVHGAFPRIKVFRSGSYSQSDRWGRLEVCEIGYSREGE